jgi:hypothetical protein
MNGPTTRLQRLLQRLEQATPMIRQDLGEWYPGSLLPALDETLATITTPGVTTETLVRTTERLGEVLRSRTATAGIAPAVRTRTPRPMGELPETIDLRERLLNECEVLVRKIIEALRSREDPQGKPSDFPKPSERS